MVPASPNFISIFYHSDTEGTNFRICLYVLRLCDVHVLYCFQLVQYLNFVKSPEVTLYGWMGYKPSINKEILALMQMMQRREPAWRGLWRIAPRSTRREIPWWTNRPPRSREWQTRCIPKPQPYRTLGRWWFPWRWCHRFQKLRSSSGPGRRAGSLGCHRQCRVACSNTRPENCCPPTRSSIVGWQKTKSGSWTTYQQLSK